jgi:hypothetical protein
LLPERIGAIELTVSAALLPPSNQKEFVRRMKLTIPAIQKPAVSRDEWQFLGASIYIYTYI